MSNKKLVVLVNGSPKTKKDPSVSDFLCNMQEGYMKASAMDVYRINVRESLTKSNNSNGKAKEDFEVMTKADAIIFSFPLYIFCLPGILMRYLQDYNQYLIDQNIKVTKQRIYTVVNCGFPEANINEEAVRVLQSFSRQVGAKFRFGVMLGGGGMLLGAIDAPFMKTLKTGLEQSTQLMADDILKEGTETLENRSYEANFPRRLYLFAGNRGWYSLIKKNGMKKKDLYRRPYLEER